MGRDKLEAESSGDQRHNRETALSQNPSPRNGAMRQQDEGVLNEGQLRFTSAGDSASPGAMERGLAASPFHSERVRAEIQLHDLGL